jgi:hypothetical protein
MASSTRARAGALTWPSLMTRETVLVPTPARSATSAIVGPPARSLLCPPGIRRGIYCSCGRSSVGAVKRSPRTSASTSASFSMAPGASTNG